MYECVVEEFSGTVNTYTTASVILQILFNDTFCDTKQIAWELK